MSGEGDDADQRVYRVMHNDEEQYSIWPADRELPLGWHAEGTTGSRTECLDHIGARVDRHAPGEPAAAHGAGERCGVKLPCAVPEEAVS